MNFLIFLFLSFLLFSIIHEHAVHRSCQKRVLRTPLYNIYVFSAIRLLEKRTFEYFVGLSTFSDRIAQQIVRLCPHLTDSIYISLTVS